MNKQLSKITLAIMLMASTGAAFAGTEMSMQTQPVTPQTQIVIRDTASDNKEQLNRNKIQMQHDEQVRIEHNRTYVEHKDRDGDNRRLYDGDNITINHDNDHDRYRRHDNHRGTYWHNGQLMSTFWRYDRDGRHDDFYRYHNHDQRRGGSWFVGLRLNPQPTYTANCAEVPMTEHVYRGEYIQSYVTCHDSDGNDYGCAKVVCN